MVNTTRQEPNVVEAYKETQKVHSLPISNTLLSYTKNPQLMYVVSVWKS